MFRIVYYEIIFFVLSRLTIHFFVFFFRNVFVCFFVLQECFAMIPPFPYWCGDPEDFDPVENEQDILFGRPEQLGQITLRPIGATEADDADFEVPIVFFSAFERVNLTHDKPMQRILDIQQLYEPGPWGKLSFSY